MVAENFLLRIHILSLVRTRKRQNSLYIMEQKDKKVANFIWSHGSTAVSFRFFVFQQALYFQASAVCQITQNCPKYSSYEVLRCNFVAV